MTAAVSKTGQDLQPRVTHWQQAGGPDSVPTLPSCFYFDSDLEQLHATVFIFIDRRPAKAFLLPDNITGS